MTATGCAQRNHDGDGAQCTQDQMTDETCTKRAGHVHLTTGRSVCSRECFGFERRDGEK